MSLQPPRAQRGLKRLTLAMIIDMNSTRLSHDDFEAEHVGKDCLPGTVEGDLNTPMTAESATNGASG